MDKQIQINRDGSYMNKDGVRHSEGQSCGSFGGKVTPLQVDCRGLKAWVYPNIRVMLKPSEVKLGPLVFSSTHFNWVPVVDQPLSLTTLRAQN